MSIIDTEILTIHVWGQHTNQAGRQAWLDEDEVDENGDALSDDYETHRGTRQELREIADQLAMHGGEHGRKVAAVLRDN